MAGLTPELERYRASVVALARADGELRTATEEAQQRSARRQRDATTRFDRLQLRAAEIGERVEQARARASRLGVSMPSRAAADRAAAGADPFATAERVLGQLDEALDAAGRDSAAVERERERLAAAQTAWQAELERRRREADELAAAARKGDLLVGVLVVAAVVFAIVGASAGALVAGLVFALCALAVATGYVASRPTSLRRRMRPVTAEADR